MLVSVPFLLVLRRLCPISKCPLSMCVHAKAKTRNQQTSYGRKRYKEHMKRHKIVSMIGMASKRARKQAYKQKGKQARKQTKGGVRGGQM